MYYSRTNNYVKKSISRDLLFYIASPFVIVTKSERVTFTDILHYSEM